MVPVLIAAGVALAGIIGGVAVATYWHEIVDWLNELVPKIKAAFQKAHKHLVHAMGLFVQKVKDTYAQIKHRLFFREQEKWFEETTTREIPESEVPEWVRKKLSPKETDVTDVAKQELELEL